MDWISVSYTLIYGIIENNILISLYDEIHLMIPAECCEFSGKDAAFDVHLAGDEFYLYDSSSGGSIYKELTLEHAEELLLIRVN